MTPHADSRRKGGPVATLNVWRADSVGGVRSGERQAVKLDLNLPSSLYVRAAEVNTRAHIEAFAQAAHGKVRHSVRWKERRRQVVYFNRALLYSFPYDGVLLPQTNSFWVKIPERVHIRAKDTGRFRRPVMERAHYEYEVASLIGLNEQPVEDLIRKANEVAEYVRKTGNLPSHTIAIRSNLGTRPVWEIESRTWFMVLGLYPHLFREVLDILRQARPTLATARVLRALEALAYRAHLTRRVRPHARRTRVWRPLYARPRPPTAPLAPPVI